MKTSVKQRCQDSGIFSWIIPHLQLKSGFGMWISGISISGILTSTLPPLWGLRLPYFPSAATIPVTHRVSWHLWINVGYTIMFISFLLWRLNTNFINKMTLLHLSWYFKYKPANIQSEMKIFYLSHMYANGKFSYLNINVIASFDVLQVGPLHMSVIVAQLNMNNKIAET